MQNAQQRRRQYRSRFSLFIPLCVCAVAACSRGAPSAPPAPVDLTAEKAALLKRDSEWQAAVNEKKDVAKIASFFSSDAIMIGSGEATATGREELTKSIEALVAAPLFNDQWSWTRVELSPDGTFAYLVGTTNITINNAAGKPVTTHARLLNVWRKDPDGVWRCVVDAWVDEP